MSDRCSNVQCGGIILADTEDWLRPLCHTCWQDQGEPEVEPKSEARNYRQWYLRDNFYARNVLHPVGDIFGTQIDVHAIEIKAYTDLLAKHERVLQMLEIAKRALVAITKRHDWMPEMGQCICKEHKGAYEAIAQIESLK